MCENIIERPGTEIAVQAVDALFISSLELGPLAEFAVFVLAHFLLPPLYDTTHV